jgi:hypothetical protein
MYAQRPANVGWVEEIGYDDAGNPVIVKRQEDVRIPDPFDVGQKRVSVMPVTANLPLAAGVNGNLVFTPTRNIEIVDLVIDIYVAAAAVAAIQEGAIHIQTVTVQGRNLLPGAGFIPCRAFRHDAAFRFGPFLQWGACEAGQNVTINVINNDAATAHNVTATLRVVMAD